MKRYTSLLTIAALSAATVASVSLAKEITFSSFKQTSPVAVPIPAIPDSTDGSNLKFDKSKLLSARRAADRFHRYDTYNWTTLLPDTAGHYILSPRDTTATTGKLHVLSTRISPERFVKGKLVANSTSMIEVFVDGKSVLKKGKSDTEMAESSADLTLAPESTSEIEVHVLTLPEDGADTKFSLRFVPEKDFEDVLIHEGPAVKRRFSIATTTEGARCNTVELSPDGKYMLVGFSETFSKEDIRRWTELRETATNRTVIPAVPAGAAWLPKGSTLYFTEHTSNGNALYAMPVKSMKREMIAANAPVDASEMMWAPDQSWFAYYDMQEGKKEEGVMKRIASPDDRMPDNRDRAYLSRYDIATGVASPLSYGGATTYICAISPDSRKLLYSSTLQTPSVYPFYSTSLVEMDVNTLATDTIATGIGTISRALYSPDGKQLLIIGGPNEFDGVGRNAPGHELANDFDNQLFLMDIATKKVRPLTKEFDPAVSEAVWNFADNTIYFSYAEGFYQRIATLNPANGAITPLPVKVDYVRNFSIGNEESSFLAYTGMGYEYAGQGWLINLKNLRNTEIANPMAKEYAGINYGKTEIWKFTSKNGDVIDGTVTLPPDFDPTKKYPMIVYYYGGTSPSSRTSHHPYTPQLFASYGYVVYVLNPSGTFGYGQEFSARHINAWGELTADEIIEGVKTICKEKPFINKDKIGCIGASYGGFMTQYLQTKTDIFACAVSHAGISNVTSYWGEGYWGYSYNSVAAAKSYPWTNPDLFTKQGSLFNADKIHTPLLLLHGTRDTNVPIGESIQLFNALKILGRDVEFITVEDQDHIITDYDKRKLWQATFMAWFAKYLQDDPRWWNSLYGD